MSETSVSRRFKLVTRIIAMTAVAAVAALALAGCSPAGEYHSIFPAVEETPPPRPDTTMNADQVQQATEALISDRNRLSAEASGNPQSKPALPAGSAAANTAAAAAAESK